MSSRRAWGAIPLVVLGTACGEAPTDPAIPVDSASTPAASVTIAPDTVRFGALGSLAQLAATARNAAGVPLTGVSVTWAVRRGGVATVSPSGVVRAVGNGVDTITATVDSVVGQTRVEVTQLPVRVTMTAPGAFDVVGDTVVIPASVVDSNGAPIPGATEAITWTSSDPAVLMAGAGGRVIAAGIGVAMVTAGFAPFADSASVSVAPVGPDGPAILGQAVPCAGGVAGPFPCSGDVELLAYLPPGGFGAGVGVRINDLWGWTDPVTGDEWALVGRSDGTAFVNVSDPIRPIYAGVLPRTSGVRASAWRDLKVYADHVFVVADNADQHGVQVFDLRALRGVSGPPRTFAETARYDGVASVHNIAVNEATGFAYAVGSNGGGQTCSGGLHMIDVRTPSAPVLAGCFADFDTGYSPGYTHDVQCVRYAGPDPDHQGSREICFGLNENALSIADVTVKSAPFAIARASYPDVRYAHQGWLSDDHRFFYSDDELDEAYGVAATSRTIVWDVSDLDDPVPVHGHLGPTAATDHNLYVRGDRLYASNYQFGIRILDLTDPAVPAELASFDTAPSEPDAPGFGGSWSNYPFFASGLVVVTSAEEGLFVLRVH